MTGIGTQIKNALGWFITRLKGNVVNNLTSTSTDLPLSAAKGKDLQDQITSLNTNMAIEDIPIHVSNVIVRSAYRIPALKLCFLSMWIDRNLIGINNHIVMLDDVIAAKTVWAPACGYTGSGNIGKTGEIYINAGTNKIMCSSTSNTNGDMEAFIVIPYQ